MSAQFRDNWTLGVEGMIEKELRVVQVAKEYDVNKLNVENGIENLISFVEGIFKREILPAKQQI